MNYCSNYSTSFVFNETMNVIAKQLSEHKRIKHVRVTHLYIQLFLFTSHSNSHNHYTGAVFPVHFALKLFCNVQGLEQYRRNKRTLI